MTRRLLNLLTTLSCVMCVAVVALWVRSYRTGPCGATMPAGSWDVESCRGQLWLFRHAPNRDPLFVRTTVHLGLAEPRPAALIKALVFDRNSPWDEKHGMPSELLSRPYVTVDLGAGVALGNAGGFAAAEGGLPAKLPGLERYAGVLQA